MSQGNAFGHGQSSCVDGVVKDAGKETGQVSPADRRGAVGFRPRDRDSAGAEDTQWPMGSIMSQPVRQNIMPCATMPPPH